MFPPTLLRVGARSAVRLLGALGALFALACGSEGGGSFDGPPPITVEVGSVSAQLLRDVATFSGALAAENTVMIKPETEGVIEEILFEEGQDVTAGTVLFRLRNAEERARVNEAEANLLLAREVYARTHKLATKDAVSQAARDEAIAQLGVAKARLELARVELDRMEVRAPFDGVLGMRLVAPGDRVTDEKALVQIDAIRRLQVAFAISELGILFTRVGRPVEVRVAPYPNEVFPGEVFFVSPTLDPATRRILAKAWVPNPGRRLRPGLFASVDMEVDKRENAILVPETAVVFDRAGTYVWKVDAERIATRVPVTTGLRKGGHVEITLGLAPGDRIVTAGTHKVQEGKPVIIAGSASSSGQALRTATGGAGEGT